MTTINESQLSRGRELGERLHAIAAEVSQWCDEIDASDADRLLRVETYSNRVLAQLQSVGVDLGTLTLVLASEGP